MAKKCRICFSERIKRFLDLGLQPWCNDFITADKLGSENKYPLDIYFCENCTTVQVMYTVPKSVMYSEHLYLSGVTKSMREHFRKVSHKALTFIDKPGLVVDIGSNDGTLLSTYKDTGMDLQGVDPCLKAANIAIDNGIATDVEFFNFAYAENLVSRLGQAKIISAANVFYHVEELHDIIKGIKYLLDKNGVFVMQGSYLPRIMEKKAFDIMYHEHLLYYRIDTLAYLLNMYGLEIIDVDEAPVHGGSIVAYISHKGSFSSTGKAEEMRKIEKNEGYGNFETYEIFAKEVKELREQIRDLIFSLKDKGQTIYAFGAPAKGTVLLNYCDITSNEIDCAVEKNHLKCGRYVPCTGIPIVNETEAEEPDYYFLLSWNFVDEFCKSELFQSGKRKFIVPIPEPRILAYEPCISNR